MRMVGALLEQSLQVIHHELYNDFIKIQFNDPSARKLIRFSMNFIESNQESI
jgi:hypothetical protein